VWGARACLCEKGRPKTQSEIGQTVLLHMDAPAVEWREGEGCDVCVCVWGGGGGDGSPEERDESRVCDVVNLSVRYDHDHSPGGCPSTDRLT
jgi:hypothetical protein